MSLQKSEKDNAEWGNIYTDQSAGDSLVDIIYQIALMDFWEQGVQHDSIEL